MNKQFEQVKAFHIAMGQPVADKPVTMDMHRQQQRFEYMAEELQEFIDATDLVDQADAMIDLIYLATGTLVELGIKPEPLFDIVQNANMSKLWEDGKARLHPDTGKVIKPPTFVRPEPLLQAEIERQIAEARNINFTDALIAIANGKTVVCVRDGEEYALGNMTYIGSRREESEWYVKEDNE